MNNFVSALKGMWIAALALVKSRKFWLAVSALTVVWLNPGVLADQITQSIMILMGLAGLITVEDAALKASGKLPSNPRQPIK